MPFVEQAIVLKGRGHRDNHAGSRILAGTLRRLLGAIQTLVRQSVLMVLEGRSEAPVGIPKWLHAASDLRLVELGGDADALLRFELATIGETAALLGERNGRWSSLATPEQTGLDLLARVIADVAARNRDSALFDPPLLRRMQEFSPVIDDPYEAIEMRAPGEMGQQIATLDEMVLSHAQELCFETPRSQPAILLGKLEGFHESTGTFSLLMENGEQAPGIYTGTEDVTAFIGDTVMVQGRAAFRPSGRLLRVDAALIGPGAGASSFWSRMPHATPRDSVQDALRKLRPARPGGMAAVIGQWPGMKRKKNFWRRSARWSDTAESSTHSGYQHCSGLRSIRSARAVSSAALRHRLGILVLRDQRRHQG